MACKTHTADIDALERSANADVLRQTMLSTLNQTLTHVREYTRHGNALLRAGMDLLHTDHLTTRARTAVSKLVDRINWQTLARKIDEDAKNVEARGHWMRCWWCFKSKTELRMTRKGFDALHAYMMRWGDEGHQWQMRTIADATFTD